MISKPSSVSYKAALYAETALGQTFKKTGLLWERAASVDIDGDGDLEIIVSTTPVDSTTRPLSGSRVIALDFKDGELVDVTTKVFPSSAKTSILRDFVVGDFNRDGIDDLYLSSQGPRESWPFPGEQNRLLISDGEGRYTDKTTNLPKYTDYSQGSVTADFNGDGKLDLFVNNQSDDQNVPSYLMFGNGAGDFGSAQFLHSRDGGWVRSARFSSDFDGLSAPRVTAVIDYMGNGTQDIYLGPLWRDVNGSQVFQGFGIAVNDGKGNFKLKFDAKFKPPVTSSDVSYSVISNDFTKTGDVDKDGDDDLLVFWEGFEDDTIQLLLNRGTKGFVDASHWIEGQEDGDKLPAVADQPDFDLVDIDGDGDLDIVLSRWASDYSGQRTLWFENDGTGHFTRIDEDAFPATRLFKFADVNNDGIQDVVYKADTWKVPDAISDAHYAGVRLGEIKTAVSRSGWNTDDSIAGGDGEDTLGGADGDDVLKGNGANDRVFGEGGHDTLFGGDGDDTVVGNAGLDVLFGGAGHDRLDAGSGNDSIVAGSGNDTVYAGSGLDTIDAGAGNDLVYGGLDRDTVVYVTSNAVTVDLAITTAQNTGNGGVDTLVDIECVSAGSGADTLSGTNAHNRLYGNGGNDRLDGRNGSDSLDGGAGRDTLIGGAGNDTLIGGIGRDVFTLGAGSDRVVFKTTADSVRVDPDQVTDFVRGEDRLDLSGIDANVLSGGNQAFVFKGSAFSGGAGQVIFKNGILSADVNGDKVADLAVALTGITALNAGDLVL